MGSCSTKMGARPTGRGRPSRPSPPLRTTLAPTVADGLVLRVMRMRADHEVSQNNADTGRSTQGRSIGGVRDQSAPTGDLLSKCIIVPLTISQVMERKRTEIDS